MQATTRTDTDRPPLLGPLTVAAAALIVIVLVFAGIRFVVDWPNIVAGTVPDDDFAERYVAHPWLAYLHLVPGVVFLVGAPLQLRRRFRSRHYTVHRRLGRVLLTCAVVAGVFALLFGIPHAWGGRPEATASVLFGTWFLACLVLAFRAIRRDDVVQHRRWMIRAFAMGVGVGTVRIWVGVFTGIQLANDPGSVTPDAPRLAGRSGWRSRCMPPPPSGGCGARRLWTAEDSGSE